jgi:hypothetical protein
MLFPQVLYFGPKQGPGLFQGLMDSTFGRVRGPDGESYHSIFMDDVCIATEGFEEYDDEQLARGKLGIVNFCSRLRQSGGSSSRSQHAGGAARRSPLRE